MRENVFVVAVPQLGVNDDTATLIEWFVEDGAPVAVGDVLCVVETAKASYEVDAEAAGLLAHLVAAGAEILVREPIAYIGVDPQALARAKLAFQAEKKAAQPGAPGEEGDAKATAKARRLATELGVDLRQIETDGIVREKDVRAFATGDEQAEPLSPADLKWNLDSTPVLIYGAARGAVTLKECLDIDPAYEVVCFIDDDPNHPTDVHGLPVFHSSLLEEVIARGVSYLATEIAAGHVRLRIREQCDKLGLTLINAVHPRAFVSPSARLGRGNFIKAGAIVATGTVVGDCCVIDNGAILAHDNVLEDGCHLTPGAALGSGIRVGKLAIVGIGANVATGVTIGRGAIITPGASVVKDVPDFAVVEGVPGKIVGKRKIE